MSAGTGAGAMADRREDAATADGRVEARFDPDGLVPAIVQDAADGRVLMLAYMDAEALAATLRTGEVHFHSRSRDRLWRKGETSGHVLRLVDLALDCDGDALLVRADPVGPTCHRGTRSCFDAAATASEEAAAGPRVAAWETADGGDPSTVGAATGGAGAERGPRQDFEWLERLWATIAERVATRPEGSYSASLAAGGVDLVGRKVTEEATEVLLAARDDAEAERAGSGRSATGAGADAGADPRAATGDALAGEAGDLLYHLLVLLAERGLEPSRVIRVLRERHRA